MLLDLPVSDHTLRHPRTPMEFSGQRTTISCRVYRSEAKIGSRADAQLFGKPMQSGLCEWTGESSDGQLEARGWIEGVWCVDQPRHPGGQPSARTCLRVATRVLRLALRSAAIAFPIRHRAHFVSDPRTPPRPGPSYYHPPTTSRSTECRPADLRRCLPTGTCWPFQRSGLFPLVAPRLASSSFSPIPSRVERLGVLRDPSVHHWLRLGRSDLRYEFLLDCQGSKSGCGPPE